jgi:hypothetical protein
MTLINKVRIKAVLFTLATISGISVVMFSVLAVLAMIDYRLMALVFVLAGVGFAANLIYDAYLYKFSLDARKRNREL